MQNRLQVISYQQNCFWNVAYLEFNQLQEVFSSQARELEKANKVS